MAIEMSTHHMFQEVTRNDQLATVSIIFTFSRKLTQTLSQFTHAIFCAISVTLFSAIFVALKLAINIAISVQFLSHLSRWYCRGFEHVQNLIMQLGHNLGEVAGVTIEIHKMCRELRGAYFTEAKEPNTWRQWKMTNDHCSMALVNWKQRLQNTTK